MDVPGGEASADGTGRAASAGAGLSIVCLMALPFVELAGLMQGPRARQTSPAPGTVSLIQESFRLGLSSLALWVRCVWLVCDDNLDAAVVGATLRTAIVSDWAILAKPAG